MASDNEAMSSQSCNTAMIKVKRQRKAPLISMAATQSCIADSMAKVIRSMTNGLAQHQCMLMLEVNKFDQVQGRILQLLQEIDFDILEEQEKKDKRKKDKAERKLMEQQNVNIG